jgi:putative colanic acid biosynthesis UDP-glucose lipid carrier transferase
MKINRQESFLIDGLRLMDGLVMIVAGWLMHQLRFASDVDAQPHPWLIFLGGFGMLLGATLVVRSWSHRDMRGPMFAAIKAWGIAWSLLLGVLVFTQLAGDTSRLWLASWAISSLLAVFLVHWIYMGMAYQLQKAYWADRRLLVVGGHDHARQVLQRIERRTHMRVRTEHLPHDCADQLRDTLAQQNPDEVWLCLDSHQTSELPKLLRVLSNSTADVRLLPDLQTVSLLNYGVSDLFGIATFNLSQSPMSSWTNQAVKWFEDKVIACMAFLAFAPIMLVITLSIKFTSRGPVLFIQNRHGWNGEVVQVYKFRTMVVDQPDASLVHQATKNDQRITPLGRFLRTTSLDELPQLINVLQGRMSLVGPRPHAVQHNEAYRELIPSYMLRHKVKPGITGWAQIKGLRGETDTIEKMAARVKADLDYIENWSIWLDLRILAITAFKGFVHKNAY